MSGSFAYSRSSFLRQALVNWWCREDTKAKNLGLRPRAPDLFERVGSILQKEPTATDEATYRALVEEVEGLRSPALPDQPPPVLSEEDLSILIILDAHREKRGALTFRAIANASVKMNLEDPKRIRRLSLSMIRQRLPVLLEARLVARPPHTQKKGVGITTAGQQAIRPARTNPTQTQRKS
jgi:hypothetical protein